MVDVSTDLTQNQEGHEAVPPTHDARDQEEVQVQEVGVHLAIHEQDTAENIKILSRFRYSRQVRENYFITYLIGNRWCEGRGVYS